ncbi:MAG: T9SS type A sorting domain-containing protein [Fibrobacteres bacterium]|nr:T9SS type A sorting domain-containing protein [Fibrobacterota bacterium]
MLKIILFLIAISTAAKVSLWSDSFILPESGQTKRESIPTASIASLNIHPNPFTSAVKFEVIGNNTNKDFTLKIYNASGKMIECLNQSSVNHNGAIIWKPGLKPAGLYLAKFSANGAVKHYKLLLMR